MCQQGASIPNSTPLKHYHSLYIPQWRVLLKSLNWTLTNTFSPRITVNFTIGIFIIPQLPLISRTLSTWRSIHATQCSLFDLADSCRSGDYISGGSPSLQLVDMVGWSCRVLFGLFCLRIYRKFASFIMFNFICPGSFEMTHSWDSIVLSNDTTW